jgi:hypothetical protein
MILHFSHIGLTDGLTFTLVLSSLIEVEDFPKVIPQPGSGDR